MASDEQDETSSVGEEVVRGEMPSVLQNIVAGLMTAAGADPISAAIAGTFIGLAHAYDRVGYGRRAERAAAMLEQAAQGAGGVERLTQRALADEPRTELTIRILEAAARTPMPEKIQALARVLAAAANDTTTVDDALILAGALSVIEAPHLQVLMRLHGRMSAASGVTTSADIEARTMDLDMLVDAFGATGRGVLLAVLQVLEGQGLVTTDHMDEERNSYVWDMRRWSTTELGEQCLGYLKKVATAV